MVYYFLFLKYFKKHFKPCFFILKALKDILQYFKFVNWRIRGFVTWCHVKVRRKQLQIESSGFVKTCHEHVHSELHYNYFHPHGDLTIFLTGFPKLGFAHDFGPENSQIYLRPLRPELTMLETVTSFVTKPNPRATRTVSLIIWL